MWTRLPGLVLSMVVVAGCADADRPSTAVSQPAITEQPAPAVTQARAPETTRPTQGPGQDLETWMFTLSLRDGSTLAIKVEQFVPGMVGELGRRLGQTIPTRFNSEGFRGQCLGVNTERDLFVPMRLTVRNTTQGLAVPIAVQLDFDAKTNGNIFSGNSKGLCSIRVDEVGLAAGREVSEFGFVVIPGYVTPALPQGDPVLAQGVRMSLIATTPRTSIADFTRESGPQLQDCSSFTRPAPYRCLPLSLT